MSERRENQRRATTALYDTISNLENAKLSQALKDSELQLAISNAQLETINARRNLIDLSLISVFVSIMIFIHVW